MCLTEAYPSGILSTQMLLGTIDHLGIGFCTRFSLSTDLPCCWPDLFFLWRASSFLRQYGSLQLVDVCCRFVAVIQSCCITVAVICSSYNNNNDNHSTPTLSCSKNLTVNVSLKVMKISLISHILRITASRIWPVSGTITSSLLHLILCG